MISMEAEQSVLGALMLDGKLYDRLVDLISAEDFGDLAHRAIWSAMSRQASAGMPLDPVTVSEALQDGGHLESVGGLAYLIELARDVPSASNAVAYARIVSEMAQRRRLLDDLEQIRAMAQDKANDVSVVLDDAQGRLLRIARADSDQAGPMHRDLEDMLDEIDRKWSGEQDAMGLSFGLSDLDRRTLGMHPPQMIIVAGRPGTGKTAFALNAVRQCCIADGNPALIFSMEMDRRALRDRMAAAVGDMPLQAIKDPRQHMTDGLWPRMTRAVQGIKDAPLIVDDRAAMSPGQIRGAAKRWRDHYGRLGLVVIDYLQLMRSDSRHSNREQEVAEASRTMKLMAKELGCPVMVLSQLNRSLEQRVNKRPVMSDLRESGALEQDADLILFLYRDELYNEHSEYRGIAEIGIGKQREGDTGTVYVAEKLAQARFENLTHGAVASAQQRKAEPKPVKRGGMAAI